MMTMNELVAEYVANIHRDNNTTLVAYATSWQIAYMNGRPVHTNEYVTALEAINHDDWKDYDYAYENIARRAGLTPISNSRQYPGQGEYVSFKDAVLLALAGGAK